MLNKEKALKIAIFIETSQFCKKQYKIYITKRQYLQKKLHKKLKFAIFTYIFWEPQNARTARNARGDFINARGRSQMRQIRANARGLVTLIVSMAVIRGRRKWRERKNSFRAFLFLSLPCATCCLPWSLQRRSKQLRTKQAKCQKGLTTE